jgi:putative FmdB family regulatory protein
MPIYDFHCRACGRPQDHDATRCPSCQSVDLERLLSSFAVSTAEKTQAAAKQSRQRQINANKEKLVADDEYRKEHEGH